MSPVLAMHSSATAEHGTPHEVVALARHVMGRIDLDPCSNAYWNKHVIHAKEFVDQDGDAADGDWCWPGAARGDRVFVNPPGGQVKEFWRLSLQLWLAGAAVFWVGFSLEQLVYLGREGAMFPGFRRVILPRRLAFLRAVDGGPPVPAKAPTHGNWLCLMPSEQEQVERFEAACRLMPAEAF
jgi:hypothetical protein